MRAALFFSALFALVALVLARSERISGTLNKDSSITSFSVRRTTSRTGDIVLKLDNFPDCVWRNLKIRVNPVNKPAFDWRTWVYGTDVVEFIIGNDVLAGTTFTLDGKLEPAVGSRCNTNFGGVLTY
ncbi:uncharacterized protein VTP21DRAFT_710 [Calcarisporiella thermophila]|uniref:uncharacterized protein n=1 Tax=Calcarisporiella thermophila TaxID=911321 RepID=UPI0037426206